MSVTWITVTDVEHVAGDTLDLHTSALFIEDVVAAANDWAYRRRREAGYHDVIASAPSDDVKLGTALVAWQWYQEVRNSSGGTFEGFPEGALVSGVSSVHINRLLGIPRGRVA